MDLQVFMARTYQMRKMSILATLTPDVRFSGSIHILQQLKRSRQQMKLFSIKCLFRTEMLGLGLIAMPKCAKLPVHPSNAPMSGD